MAQTDYQKFRDLAERLITKAGRSAVVYTPEQTGQDPFGGETTVPAIEVDGYVTPLFEFGTEAKLGATESSSIQVGDKYAFFHITSGSVAEGMLLDADSYTWSVKGIEYLDSPAGLQVYTKLHLRRG